MRMLLQKQLQQQQQQQPLTPLTNADVRKEEEEEERKSDGALTRHSWTLNTASPLQPRINNNLTWMRHYHSKLCRTASFLENLTPFIKKGNNEGEEEEEAADWTNFLNVNYVRALLN